MKRCIKAHRVDSFGDIPVGSLWDDDSPFIVEADCFVDADAAVEVDEPAPVKRVARPVKSVAKPVTEES